MIRFFSVVNIDLCARLMKRLSIGAIFAVFSLAANASAPKLSSIESYLNGLKKIAADVEQWDVNGAYKTGKLFLQKPGRLRLNYNNPSSLVILADGKILFFADRKSGDLSYMPIQDSPASFLLQPNLDIQRNFTISEFSFDSQFITLILKRKNNEDIGSLKLTFQRLGENIILTQWIVIDPQGKKTIVKLSNLTNIKSFDKKLFDSNVLLK